MRLVRSSFISLPPKAPGHRQDGQGGQGGRGRRRILYPYSCVDDRVSGAGPAVGAVDLDRPEIMSHNFPFLKDTLARAYIRAGELDKAIHEYESLLKFDPKSHYRRYLHPKYWYRLAKLYEQKSYGSKAAAAYEKFLELWNRADPDHPEIADARQKLAQLK